MKNYTSQTAALKTVTIDTHKLDANRIDTKKLFVNGVSIDELSGKNDEDFLIDVIFVLQFRGFSCNACYYQYGDKNVQVNVDQFGGTIHLNDGSDGISYVKNSPDYIYNITDEGVQCFNDKLFLPLQLTFDEDLNYFGQIELWKNGDNLNEIYGGLFSTDVDL